MYKLIFVIATQSFNDSSNKWVIS